MKKSYLLLVVLCITSLTYAQIGPTWWMFLPADYATNPYQRQNISVAKVGDASIAGAASLEALWNTLETQFINTLDNPSATTVDDYSTGSKVKVALPNQSADDFTGRYSVMAGENYLYLLFNVLDDDVLPTGGDKLEFAFAPYANKYDPGRELFLNDTHWGYYQDGDGNKFYVWGGFDATTGAPKATATVISEADYTDMAKYSTWTETGANKIDLNLVTNDAPASGLAYSLFGVNDEILGDVSAGSTIENVLTLMETKSTGYYFLVAIPWTEFSNDFKLSNDGDAMSLAIKMNDADSDNLSHVDKNANTKTAIYGYWGNTTNNNAYWAVAYYGAIATLVDVSSSVSSLERPSLDVVYANNKLVLSNQSKACHIEIYSMSGVKVMDVERATELDVSALNYGVYVAVINNGSTDKKVVKFSKL